MKTGPKSTALDVTLETGYEVPVRFTARLSRNLEHLGNALIGEIVFPAMRRAPGYEPWNHLISEVCALVKRLEDADRRVLLALLVLDLVGRNWDALITRNSHKEERRSSSGEHRINSAKPKE
jgi:hypothetical protein